MEDGERELRRAFAAAVERDDPSELQRLVARVAQESADREWAETCCVHMARHRNAHVRGNALLGFGHLARRFGHLDRRRVHRLIDIGLHAHHEYVRAQAESAADDAATFLSWRFDRPRRH